MRFFKPRKNEKIVTFLKKSNNFFIFSKFHYFHYFHHLTLKCQCFVYLQPKALLRYSKEAPHFMIGAVLTQTRKKK